MKPVFAQPIEQYPNHLRFSTVPNLSAGADAAFPASNLVNYDPTKVTRVNASAVTITWNFGRSRNFDVVSLISSSVGPRTTITISVSDDGGAWTQIHTGPFWANLAVIPGPGPWDEDVDPRKGSLERNDSWYLSPTLLKKQYIRLAVSDPDSASMTFGRLFVGKTFRPKTNIQYGSAFSFDDTGTKDRTDQGAQALLPGRSIVSARLKMDFLSTDEMYDYVWEFNYWRQGCREVLVNLDTGSVVRAQKNILYATISEGRQVVAEEFNAWSQTWILESI